MTYVCMLVLWCSGAGAIIYILRLLNVNCLIYFLRSDEESRARRFLSKQTFTRRKANILNVSISLLREMDI